MKTRKVTTTRSPERTKSQLVAAARKLFALRGFYGTTVQEIATEAGVNASLISHYYAGKEGLYKAAIAGFAEARLQALERVLATPHSPEEFRLRIEMFANELMTFHLENREITVILIRDMMYESERWGQENITRLFSFFARLVEYFTEAKDKGYMNAQIEPLNIAGVLYLNFLALLQSSAMIKKSLFLSIDDPEIRQMVVKQTLHTLWTGIEPR